MDFTSFRAVSKFSKKQVPLQLFPVLTSCPSYERLRARGFQPTSVHYFEEQKNRHHWTTNDSIWRWWLRNSRHWKHRYKIDNDRRTYYTCIVNAAVQDIFLQDTLSREGHLAQVIIAIIYGLLFGFLCHLRFVMCWTSNAGALPKKKLKLEGAMKLFINIQDSFEANACKPKKSFVQSSIQLIHLGQLRGNMWKSSGLI